MRTARLYVDGMYCAACGIEIERALYTLPGVLSANVSALEGCAVIRYEEEKITLPCIREAIQDAGYTAEEYTCGAVSALKQGHADRLFRKTALSLILSLPLTMPVPLPLKAVLAAAVQFIPGAEFYRDAFYGLRNKSLGLPFMVAFSTTCTWAFSVYAMARGNTGQIYFDSSALIITMIRAGRLVEARMDLRAGSVLESLHALMPQKARAVKEGKETWRELSDISVGETVAVREGERIPLDGTLVSGGLLVDESMLTGEADPKAKAQGDALFAGTLNTQGEGVIRVTSDSAHTVLAGILADVSNALSGKSRIQTLTDQVIQIFCPAVIAAAAIAGCLWLFVFDPGNSGRALNVFVSAVVVACPCALGFSAPLSTAGAVAAAAENGILIKEAGVIERLAKLRSIGFDKTGTLTDGCFTVSDIVLLHAESAEEMLLHAAVAEKSSLHPLAQAVIRYVGKGPTELPDAQSWQSYPGKGVTAYWDGAQYAVGSLTFAAELGASSTDLEKIRNLLHGQTKSVLVILKDGIVEGACFLQDAIRADAEDTLRALRKMGIACYMMTGDREAATKETAGQLGLEEWYSGLLPGQKAALLREKQALGGAGMVGDGLNDLSTLSCADVGFAVGSAAWPADAAADIVLMDGKLAKIPVSIAIAQKAMRIVRQNLLLSCLYNLAALGMAVCGLLTPVIAAAAMSVSSISVVANSQRVRKVSI